jgi:hypothetical protein
LPLGYISFRVDQKFNEIYEMYHYVPLYWMNIDEVLQPHIVWHDRLDSCLQKEFSIGNGISNFSDICQ